MESSVKVFTTIPDAVVHLTGISQMKKYLLDRILSWDGMPVVKFNTFGAEVFVYVADETRNKTKKHFFGYIEDVALNIQHGMYEEQGVNP